MSAVEDMTVFMALLYSKCLHPWTFSPLRTSRSPRW